MKTEKIIRTNPLFQRYPALEGRIPWIALGRFPVSVHKLEKLGKHVGASNLWIKREDSSGELYGGNKIRKLEFTLAEARSRNKEFILTFGGSGSNHVLATTIYAKSLGMKTVAILVPQPPTFHVSRNLRAYAHYGTQVLYLEDSLKLPKLLAQYPKRNLPKTYILPPGGSNVTGTLGFVNCAFEIYDQAQKGIMPMPKYIWLAAGTGGTVAGLLLGAKLCGLDAKIMAVRVTQSNMVNEQIVAMMVNKTSKFLTSIDPSVPEVSIEPYEVEMLKGFLGPGYGHVTPEAKEAIELVEDLEGIDAEGTYTAKAIAAMIRNVPYDPDAPMLYLHTYNSVNIFDDIPDDVDLSVLPEPLQKIAAGEV